MRSHSVPAVMAGATAIALASVLVASPAAGATLPEGQKLTTVAQFEVEEDEFVTQMLDTSPADATSTAIGPQDGPFILEGIDVDDDGHGYAVQTSLGTPTNSPYLWVADANTGVFSDPVLIDPTTNITITSCNGIDLQPNGEILIACYNFQNTDFVQDSYIGVVTPAGAFTPFVTNGVSGAPLVEWDALAYNPVNGELWAFGGVFVDQDGGYIQPSAFQVTDRALGTVGPAVPTESSLESADYDRDGQLFVMSVEQGPVLGTMVASTGVIDLIETPRVDGDTVTVRALTVWGKAALPATGPAPLVPLGIGTALLFLAGAAFIATSRRRAVTG